MATTIVGKIVLTPQGEYSASATYTHLDWVRYNGASWVCKQDNTTGVTPIEGAYWSCLSEKGTDGQDGADGEDGVGIESIEKTDTVGLVDTYTITYTDGNTSTFTVTNGRIGADGEDGTSLTATSSKLGKVTTVLIKNAETEEVLTTLTINDGADGSGGGGDMRKAVYDTNEDGIVDAAETLDGLTASVTELNYMDGVTSNVQTQIDSKVDQVTGKGLSSNDYTTEDKTKLSGIAVGAEVNVIGSVDGDFSVSNKQLSLSNTVKGKLVEAVNPTLVGTETSVNGLQIGNTKYKVGGGHELDTSVSTVENTASENNHVPSSYVLKQYANRYTNCLVVANIASGATYYEVTDDLLKDDNATFEFFFEPNSNNDVVVLKKYTLNTTTGYLKVEFQSALTATTRFRVDVTTYRA